MIRIPILYQTRDGFEALWPFVRELWATPCFRARDHTVNNEKQGFYINCQMRCLFLCFLGRGIVSNSLFYSRTIRNSIIHHLLVLYRATNLSRMNKMANYVPYIILNGQFCPGGAGPKWLDPMPVKGWVTQQARPVRVWNVTGPDFPN